MSTTGLLKSLRAFVRPVRFSVAARRRSPNYFRAMEALESRQLMTTSSLAITPGGHSATYTEMDGDHVTVAVSAGVLTSANFVMLTPANSHDQLQTLNLTSNTFTGTNVTVSVVRALTGDGLANVGFINAAGVDIGAVSVAGDLGRINAGDAHTSTNAMTSLSVRTMGRMGIDTQEAGGNLESDILGNLGSLTVKGDIKDAFIHAATAGDSVNANIGLVTISGSVIGGTVDRSGTILADGSLGLTKISGDVIGGDGSLSGLVQAVNGTFAGATIGGSIIGGAGFTSGSVYSNFGTMGPISVGGDVVGGAGAFSAYVGSYHASAGNITIGGSLVGGTGPTSGVLRCPGNVGDVKIGGDMVAGSDSVSGSIAFGGTLHSLTIGGSVGTLVQASSGLGVTKISGDVSGTIRTPYGAMADITIGGSLSGTLNSSTSFGKLAVTGDVSGLVLASSGGITSVTIGGSVSGTISATSSIPTIKIGRDLTGNLHGATLGSLAISGSIVGGSAASTGLIDSATIGTVTVGHDIAGGAGANSGVIRATGALGNVTIGGSVLGGGGANSGQVAGKKIGNVKIGGNLVIGVNNQAGLVGTPATLNGSVGSVTIGGFVSGSVYCPGTMGPVKIGGDVTGLVEAGTVPSITIGGSVIGGAGNATGLIVGLTSLGNVIVGGDVRGGSAGSTGYINSHGTMGAVSIGGSLIGGTAFTTGTIYAQQSIGAVKIGHDVVGTAGGYSGSIRSGNAGIASVTIGGSLIGGTATGQSPNNAAIQSGCISAITTVGAVKIGHDLRGGNGIGAATASQSGAILAGNLTSVSIGGSLIGGTGNVAGAIITSGSMGAVTIAHDLRGGNPNGTISSFTHAGVIQAGGRIAAVTVGGSILAGKGDGSGAFTFNGAIQAGKDIGALTVKGSIAGNLNGTSVTYVMISAQGQASPPATSNVTIGSITVGGRVEFADFFAGYNTSLVSINGDAQIGAVKIGGDWIASNLVAGAENVGSGNTKFGDSGDGSIGAGNVAIFSSIASIKIAGQVYGTPAAVLSTDQYGFVAQTIGSLQVGGINVTLNAAAHTDSFALGPNGDVNLHEI